ncbi:hypothetical protein GFM13_19325 [Rhizobium leguminosarum bv. viciae]|nr:hypothetical protein [Rhizobium leguminosarum bv. viciae]
MSVMEEGSEPRGEPRLQVWIGNNDPIAAEQLGKFIRELAVDYRRQTEGQLVLARLELGSTFLEFADQAVAYSNYVAAPLVFMEAAKRMGQFYKFLAKQLKGPSDDQLLLPPPIDPSPARLLEIAANAKADLRIIQVAEVKTIELKFPEVLMRNEAAKIKKKKRKKAAAAEGGIYNIPVELGEITERVRAQALSDPNQLESLIEIVVGLLRSSGAGHQLPSLAQNLEANNLWQAAVIVRRHIVAPKQINLRDDG